MKLSKKDWNKIADYIKANTCGCIYNKFTGEDLKKGMEKK